METKPSGGVKGKRYRGCSKLHHSCSTFVQKTVVNSLRFSKSWAHSEHSKQCYNDDDHHDHWVVMEWNLRLSRLRVVASIITKSAFGNRLAQTIKSLGLLSLWNMRQYLNSAYKLGVHTTHINSKQNRHCWRCKSGAARVVISVGQLSHKLQFKCSNFLYRHQMQPNNWLKLVTIVYYCELWWVSHAYSLWVDLVSKHTHFSQIPCLCHVTESCITPGNEIAKQTQCSKWSTCPNLGSYTEWYCTALKFFARTLTCLHWGATYLSAILSCLACRVRSPRVFHMASVSLVISNVSRKFSALRWSPSSMAVPYSIRPSSRV